MGDRTRSCKHNGAARVRAGAAATRRGGWREAAGRITASPRHGPLARIVRAARAHVAAARARVTFYPPFSVTVIVFSLCYNFSKQTLESYGIRKHV